MPRYRRVAAVASAAGLVTLWAVVASAAPLEVWNCAKSGIFINVDVYNGNDLIRAVPFSSASGLGGGESRMLGCATAQCQAGIDYPAHISPPVLHGTNTTVYGGGVPMLRSKPNMLIPSSRLCVFLTYDANGDHIRFIEEMRDDCHC